MSALPLGDPQFWLVTAAAVGALLYLGRKRLRFRRKGAVELPCDNCSQADVHAPGGASRLLKRRILGASRKS